MVRRIETERLILRTVTVDDAEAIFKWASLPGEGRNLCGSGQARQLVKMRLEM